MKNSELEATNLAIKSRFGIAAEAFAVLKLQGTFLYLLQVALLVAGMKCRLDAQNFVFNDSIRPQQCPLHGSIRKREGFTYPHYLKSQ